jgi:hypothetical protein
MPRWLSGCVERTGRKKLKKNALAEKKSKKNALAGKTQKQRTGRENSKPQKQKERKRGPPRTGQGGCVLL